MVVVLRHGARQPIAPRGLKACIARTVGGWARARGRLTPLGKSQHRQLGAWFGRHMLSGQEQVRVAWAPEDTRRCELSARAFMAGLHDSAPRMQPVVLNTGHAARWERVFRSHKSCKRFLHLQAQLEGAFQADVKEAASQHAAFARDVRALLAPHCRIPGATWDFQDAVKALRQFVLAYEVSWKHGRLTPAAHTLRRRLAACVRAHFHMQLGCLQAAYFQQLHWDVPSAQDHQAVNCLGIGQLARVIARDLAAPTESSTPRVAFYFAHDSTLLRLLAVLGVRRPPQPDFAAFAMLRRGRAGLQLATNLTPWQYPKQGCAARRSPSQWRARMRPYTPHWRTVQGGSLDSCAVHIPDARAWRASCG